MEQASQQTEQQVEAADPAIEAGMVFLRALFVESDAVLFRPIEAWTENGQKKSRVDYKGIQYTRAGANVGNVIKRHNERSERTKTNIFFGVCPRFGTAGQYDLAWQIRVVRVLWSDVDHCTVNEALDRCKAAGVPKPSIIVASGNGAHLYWLLTEPCLIDDAPIRRRSSRSLSTREKARKRSPKST
jgi:hypothetical protein